MSEHWTDEYKTMIEDCGRRPQKLNEWEETFLGSVSEQLEERKNLSAKQCVSITKIWERVTRNG